jgi:hypothetical protein
MKEVPLSENPEILILRSELGEFGMHRSEFLLRVECHKRHIEWDEFIGWHDTAPGEFHIRCGSVEKNYRAKHAFDAVLAAMAEFPDETDIEIESWGGMRKFSDRMP